MKIYKSYTLTNFFKLTIFFIILSFLFLFSKDNFTLAKDTINLFFASVMPSLFPFLLFSEIIIKTDIVNILSRLFGKLFSKIFRINKNSSICIIIGFLCGFPMGAKSVINCYDSNLINKNDANILLSFINNCNPIFILSTISLGIFGNIKIGIILLSSHIISSLILGIMTSRFTYNNNIIQKKLVNLKSLDKKSIISTKKNQIINNQSLFEIIKNSILNTFISLELILGFMIIFNSFGNITHKFMLYLHIPYNFSCYISALFEVTKGCYNIGNLDINYKLKLCIISFMLGFSGLCIIFQIYSVIYNKGFKLSKLIFFKLFNGIISFFITYIILTIFDISSVTPSYSSIDNNLYINNHYFPYFTYTTYFIITFIFIIFFIKGILNKRAKHI